MVGDNAHAQLLESGWRWNDATSYERTVAGLTLNLTPTAHVQPDMPTEERFRKLRTGRWLLRRGGTPLAAFESLMTAATAVIVGAAHAP